MIIQFNLKTVIALAIAVALAMLLPPYLAMGLGATAGLYALVRLFRAPGAPNGLPWHKKPPIWYDNARRYGLVGVVFTYNAVMMFRMTELFAPIPASSDRATFVMMAGVSLVFALMGYMMSSTLKGAGDHAQDRADEEAAKGNGPKCTCTRKCGMC